MVSLPASFALPFWPARRLTSVRSEAKSQPFTPLCSETSDFCDPIFFRCLDKIDSIIYNFKESVKWLVFIRVFPLGSILNRILTRLEGEDMPIKRFSPVFSYFAFFLLCVYFACGCCTLRCRVNKTNNFDSILLDDDKIVYDVYFDNLQYRGIICVKNRLIILWHIKKNGDWKCTKIAVDEIDDIVFEPEKRKIKICMNGQEISIIEKFVPHKFAVSANFEPIAKSIARSIVSKALSLDLTEIDNKYRVELAIRSCSIYSDLLECDEFLNNVDKMISWHENMLNKNSNRFVSGHLEKQKYDNFLNVRKGVLDTYQLEFTSWGKWPAHAKRMFDIFDNYKSAKECACRYEFFMTEIQHQFKSEYRVYNLSKSKRQPFFRIVYDCNKTPSEIVKTGPDFEGNVKRIVKKHLDDKIETARILTSSKWKDHNKFDVDPPKKETIPKFITPHTENLKLQPQTVGQKNFSSQSFYTKLIEVIDDNVGKLSQSKILKFIGAETKKFLNNIFIYTKTEDSEKPS
jgi:hypothetical protein